MPPIAPHPTRPPSETKILVVDDEASNLEVIGEFLRLEGYQVLTAVDGEQALERVEANQPDLVLLDILMPRLDGYEVCRRLKNSPQTVFTPVVMITALKGTDEKIRGVEVGADDFLTKPFNHLELVTRVKSLLRVKFLNDAIDAYNRQLEQRVAERTAQLQRALEDLQELDRLKSEFIGNVSHELRTPLLHIKGYVALLADRTLGPLNAEQAKGVDTALQAVDTLERLVEDLIGFGAHTTGRLNFQAVHLAEVAELAVAMLGRAIARYGAAPRLDIPPGLPRVRADRQALARVLRHLLENGLKFSPDKPEVILLARPVNGGQRVRVSVVDHGIGVPPEQRARIFDVFYQVDGSITRRYGGAGMGLALVKLLVEGHGSRVHLESEPDKGSIFWFDLPAAGE